MQRPFCFVSTVRLCRWKRGHRDAVDNASTMLPLTSVSPFNSYKRLSVASGCRAIRFGFANNADSQQRAFFKQDNHFAVTASGIHRSD
jgi:hypothetical protein